MIKCITVALAAGAAVCGLIAAHYWYESGKVNIVPEWDFERVDERLKQMGWNAALIKANTESAALNKTAARWTALSVALGGACSIIGAIG
jgi:hypothetical protein